MSHRVAQTWEDLGKGAPGAGTGIPLTHKTLPRATLSEITDTISFQLNGS